MLQMINVKVHVPKKREENKSISSSTVPSSKGDIQIYSRIMHLDLQVIWLIWIVLSIIFLFFFIGKYNSLKEKAGEPKGTPKYMGSK